MKFAKFLPTLTYLQDFQGKIFLRYVSQEKWNQSFHFSLLLSPLRQIFFLSRSIFRSISTLSKTTKQNLENWSIFYLLTIWYYWLRNENILSYDKENSRLSQPRKNCSHRKMKMNRDMLIFVKDMRRERFGDQFWIESTDEWFFRCILRPWLETLELLERGEYENEDKLLEPE